LLRQSSAGGRLLLFTDMSLVDWRGTPRNGGITAHPSFSLTQ
jgi:hypothetical protein